MIRISFKGRGYLVQSESLFLSVNPWNQGLNLMMLFHPSIHCLEKSQRRPCWTL
jgi:hypothetical protein